MNQAVSAAARALPSTERGRRTRASIVDAAARLMYERGVAATSLDDVLAACGAGKSQMYHYFTDKKDLVRAVVGRQLELVLGGQPRLQAIGSWADLEAWAADIVAVHQTSAGPLACPVGSLAAEIDRDDDLRPVAAAAFRTWAEPLRAALATLQARGEVGARQDPEALALRVLVTVQGGLLMARTLDDPAVLADALARLLADLRAPAG